MSYILDMLPLYRKEPKRWPREDAPRRSFRDQLDDSVPHLIIVVALVLYPCSAGVFDKLTPGWDRIAPIGALVAGERLTALALELRDDFSLVDATWQEAEFTVIHRAVCVRYLHHGLAERDARQRTHPVQVESFSL